MLFFAMQIYYHGNRHMHAFVTLLFVGLRSSYLVYRLRGPIGSANYVTEKFGFNKHLQY